jgi:hypothetical protein
MKVPALVLVIAITFGLGAFHAQAPGNASPAAITTLVRLAKTITIAAARVGLEQAGTEVLGSNWKLAKAVVEPLYQELTRRYPALALVNTPAATSAASKAANLLDSDTTLRALLLNRFDRLETGQAQILLQLIELQNAVERNTALQARILRQLEANDSTGTLVRVDPLLDAIRRLPPSDQRDRLLIVVSISRFRSAVAESPNREASYRRTLPGYVSGESPHLAPTKYTATVSGIFTVEGRPCRTIGLTFYAEDQGRTLSPGPPVRWCSVEGRWQAR